jgi:hypothetical protein
MDSEEWEELIKESYDNEMEIQVRYHNNTYWVDGYQKISNLEKIHRLEWTYAPNIIDKLFGITLEKKIERARMSVIKKIQHEVKCLQHAAEIHAKFNNGGLRDASSGTPMPKVKIPPPDETRG